MTAGYARHTYARSTTVAVTPGVLRTPRAEEEPGAGGYHRDMRGVIVVPAVVAARVRQAMGRTPRSHFLPADVRHLADTDLPVPIGWEATNSQPSTVARMLELLDVRPGHRVLDVGSGSGWTTAILTRLAGPDGVVLGVERVPELVDWARRRLAEAGIETTVEEAVPGVLGLPAQGPFDRILVSADFARRPDDLVAQLAEGGRLVAPVAEVMTIVDVHDGHERTRADAGRYVFVPLRAD